MSKKLNIKAMNAEDAASFWKNKYQSLQKEFEQYQKESIKWSTQDFIDLEVDGYRITEEQAYKALEHMIRKHDCNDGITWDTVGYYYREYGTEDKSVVY